MFRPSPKEAETLRRWFDFQAALYDADIKAITLPHMPLAMMLLVYLSYQPDGSASYAELRAACRLTDPSSLSHAATKLRVEHLVMALRSKANPRERVMQITDQGCRVVGRVLHSLSPKPLK